ncbi:MAG: B12-binding domain-containing radical SAM protein [Clostridia bacterium]|nr:B12-binding domain-containing radical SAM protein [Clostridia bacterium]
MKVVIACLNSKYIHSSLAPWCLASGVKAYCGNDVDFKVMEATINGDIDEFASRIIAEKPDVVSFSCYIWNVLKTIEACSLVKEKLRCKIIVGGPEVSYRADDVLNKYSFVDYVLCGEGEETFPELINKIKACENYSDVAGLAYRLDDKIIINDEKEYIGTPVSPYIDEYFENLSGRICYIETSRGCPYRCAYCLSGRCSPLRFFDLDRVKNDIIKLSNSGTKTVKFVDRTFNANSKRANEIISFILENRGGAIPENVCFHFEIAGDILTEETYHLLSIAPEGLFQLEIGMQSFNEETLKIINRKTDTERLVKNIEKLVASGNMHIHIDLIAGLTGENIKSFERSFDIGYNLKAHMLQMGFLKLLHGADMRENPDKYPCVFSDTPPYEVIKTPWLSEDELKSLKRCEDALERMYNSGRFLYTLDYLLNDCGYTPFRLFYEFGNSVKGSKMSLSDYAVEIYNHFAEKSDSEILREKLICDMLSCSSALQIPDVLKRKDKDYKKLKKHFVEFSGKYNKIAVLYKSGKVFVVDQNGKKDLHGRFVGEFYNLNDFE